MIRLCCLCIYSFCWILRLLKFWIESYRASERKAWASKITWNFYLFESKIIAAKYQIKSTVEMGCFGQSQCVYSPSWERQYITAVCLAGCRSGGLNLEIRPPEPRVELAAPQTHCLPAAVTHHLLSTVFQAMKGEKGIPGVTVGDGLGEELTDETFSKWGRRRSVVSVCFLSSLGCIITLDL